jgi:dienelactone hydrolase
VLWGNGACRDDGLGYAQFLREIASHGFFVVSLGYPRVEPAIEAAPTPAAPAPPAQTVARGQDAPLAPVQRAVDPTQYTQLLDAIGWAERQNMLQDGPFKGRVDTTRIAVMGHSCGGLQAIAAAADPRIDTAVIMNSGVVNGGPSTGRSGIDVVKDQLRHLHGPVAYITGGPSDVAQPNAADDVQRISHVPVFWAFDNSGHGGTYRRANGAGYARVATAWLQWQLKGDAAASRLFTGRSCGLCADGAWTVTRKGVE